MPTIRLVDSNMSKTEIIKLRAEPAFRQQLQDAINQGYGKTMSEVIRKAVTQVLKEGPGNE